MEPNFYQGGNGNGTLANLFGAAASLGTAYLASRNPERRVQEPDPLPPEPPGSTRTLLIVGGAIVALIAVAIVARR